MTDDAFIVRSYLAGFKDQHVSWKEKAPNNGFCCTDDGLCRRGTKIRVSGREIDLSLMEVAWSRRLFIRTYQ